MTYQVDIRIEIDKVEVTDYEFTFKYKVFINKKLTNKGTYAFEHFRRNDKAAFKAELENGWAAHLIILEILKLPSSGS
jgi:hypothetical protein